MRLVITGLVLLCMAGIAGASIGTVTASNDGFFTDGYINIAGARNVTGYGGIYYLNKTAGTGDGALLPNGRINSFCIDLFQDSAGGSAPYDVWMPEFAPIPGVAMGTDRANKLRELWGNYFLIAAADPQKAEAFSACVWEIVFETDTVLTVSSGTGFSCSDLATGMPDLANGWLASLNGSGPLANLRAITSETYQDYLVEVPEPATLSLLALGGLAMLRRRKK